MSSRRAAQSRPWCARPSADKVNKFTVFNVGGGGYRGVTAIHFNRQKLYIRHVFTHSEYERWSTKLRK